MGPWGKAKGRSFFQGKSTGSKSCVPLSVPSPSCMRATPRLSTWNTIPPGAARAILGMLADSKRLYLSSQYRTCPVFLSTPPTFGAAAWAYVSSWSSLTNERRNLINDVVADLRPPVATGTFIAAFFSQSLSGWVMIGVKVERPNPPRCPCRMIF